jgi:hypothetical protein
VAPDALSFRLDACAKGTGVEGAELEILQMPGRAIDHAPRINPDMELLLVSAETGEGMGAWYDWLVAKRARSGTAAVQGWAGYGIIRQGPAWSGHSCLSLSRAAELQMAGRRPAMPLWLIVWFTFCDATCTP